MPTVVRQCMDGAVTFDVKCSNPKCGKVGHVLADLNTNAKLAAGARLRCMDCGSLALQCFHCNFPISPARLAAVPQTRYCADCAREGSQMPANRKVKEPWGTREAFKKDRASWQRHN